MKRDAQAVAFHLLPVTLPAVTNAFLGKWDSVAMLMAGWFVLFCAFVAIRRKLRFNRTDNFSRQGTESLH